MTLPKVKTVAGMIDHAILKPTVTRQELVKELNLAAKYEIFSVCVRPCDVYFAVSHLASLKSEVAVGTVIGFPHGTTSTASKVAEVSQALLDGAVEFDVVINVSYLKSGLLDEVREDLNSVVAAAEEHVVKVIFENDLLTTEEKIQACQVSGEAGADFVKTSTGFSTGGATREDLMLMREYSSPEMEVKASGGVRGLDTLLEFMSLGVTRFGTSATSTILDDLENRSAGGRALHSIDESSY